jgi:DNA replication protein DnaC
MRQRYDEFAAAALREQASYKRFLADLLEAEAAERAGRRKLRLVHEAGFARPKRLEDFDYTANPAISAEVIGALADPSWVRQGHPLCLLGDSGTGKSGSPGMSVGHPVRGLGTTTLTARLPR